MTGVTFQAIPSDNGPSSFSAQGIRQVLSWRNRAENTADVILRRAASEVGFVSLALLALVECVVRPIFSLLALVTDGQSSALHHYDGFKKSVFTILNTPFLLIENIFCTNIRLISL
ncbi:MAG: hypothetical protein Tsb0015_11300 [Simkaniaceae bacterium]